MQETFIHFDNLVSVSIKDHKKYISFEDIPICIKSISDKGTISFLYDTDDLQIYLQIYKKYSEIDKIIKEYQEEKNIFEQTYKNCINTLEHQNTLYNISNGKTEDHEHPSLLPIDQKQNNEFVNENPNQNHNQNHNETKIIKNIVPIKSLKEIENIRYKSQQDTLQICLNKIKKIDEKLILSKRKKEDLIRIINKIEIPIIRYTKDEYTFLSGMNQLAYEIETFKNKNTQFRTFKSPIPSLYYH